MAVSVAVPPTVPDFGDSPIVMTCANADTSSAAVVDPAPTVIVCVDACVKSTHA